jgi:hypothetical protein
MEEGIQAPRRRALPPIDRHRYASLRSRILYWDTAIGIQDVGGLPLAAVMAESGVATRLGRVPSAAANHRVIMSCRVSRRVQHPLLPLTVRGTGIASPMYRSPGLRRSSSRAASIKGQMHHRILAVHYIPRRSDRAAESPRKVRVRPARLGANASHSVRCRRASWPALSSSPAPAAPRARGARASARFFCQATTRSGASWIGLHQRRIELAEPSTRRRAGQGAKARTVLDVTRDRTNEC